jgi:RNA polymerase sigma-70 factor (ECF subfamily)
MPVACRVEDLAQYRPKLVRFAQARLFNPAHAEDAVQETLLAAIESLGTFSGGGSLYSWLTGILKHKIVDCVRRSARDRWQELDGGGTPLESDHPHCRAVGDPEQAMARRQVWEALVHCMRDLPERTADNYILRELIGMNTAETCHALNVSESNCAVMLHRARARIRETFGRPAIAP